MPQIGITGREGLQLSRDKNTARFGSAAANLGEHGPAIGPCAEIVIGDYSEQAVRDVRDRVRGARRDDDVELAAEDPRQTPQNEWVVVDKENPLSGGGAGHRHRYADGRATSLRRSHITKR